MKPDTVSLFKQAGHSEGGVESARGNAKARKGQGGGAVGGASDFAKLLGHSAKQLASDDELPLAAAGERDDQHHGDQQGASGSPTHGLASESGRDRQPGDGVNRRRQPVAPADVRTAELHPAQRPVAVDTAPEGVTAPSDWQAQVTLERAHPRAARETPASTPAPRVPVAAPAAPSSGRAPAGASPAAVMSPAPAPARQVTSPSTVVPSPSTVVASPSAAKPAQSVSPAATTSPAAPVRTAAPGVSPVAAAPVASASQPAVSAAARPVLPSTAAAPAPVVAPAAPVTAVAPAAKAERPIPASPPRAAAPAAASPQARPAVPPPEVAASRPAEAPVVASPARERGPAAMPARTGAPLRPASTAVAQPESPTAAPAPQAPLNGAKVPSRTSPPESRQVPSQPPVGAEQRPTGVERRAPQLATAPTQPAQAAAVVKAADKQVEQAPPAGAPARAPQRPYAPVVVQPLDQPEAAAPARSEPTSQVAPERDSASGAIQPARNDRRPLRAVRPEAQASKPDDGRAVEAPAEAPTIQRPLSQRAAMAALAGQAEIAEGQPELRRATESQPGLPAAEAAPGRPRLRARERAAGEDEATDDRRPMRLAVEKEIPTLLLMQLSAPAPVPPPDLGNARLQVLARDGRRGLESAAIISAGADALQVPGTDASRSDKLERELPWQGPALTLPQDATLPASLNGTATIPEGPAAPPLPPAAAPLLDQAALDPGLNVAVMSKAAHMTITNEDGRALELHLRMSPEGADIRATGNLAPMVQARVAELGMALASQGLTLGSFEMGRDGQGRSSRDGDEDRDSARDEAPSGRRSVRASSPTGAGPVTNVAGRIHVKV